MPIEDLVAFALHVVTLFFAVNARREVDHWWIRLLPFAVVSHGLYRFMGPVLPGWAYTALLRILLAIVPLLLIGGMDWARTVRRQHRRERSRAPKA
jgi:hypothetical protein